MDHRDVAAATQQWWEKKSINEKAMTLDVAIPDSEGEEIVLTVPFRYDVCRICDGKGNHANPNIDRQGLTQEDFDQDPDFLEDYMRGTYNVPCFLCGGQRVVPIPNEQRIWENPDHLQAVKDKIHELAQEARETVQNIEMGY